MPFTMKNVVYSVLMFNVYKPHGFYFSSKKTWNVIVVRKISSGYRIYRLISTECYEEEQSAIRESNSVMRTPKQDYFELYSVLFILFFLCTNNLVLFLI